MKNSCNFDNNGAFLKLQFPGNTPKLAGFRNNPALFKKYLLKGEKVKKKAPSTSKALYRDKRGGIFNRGGGRGVSRSFLLLTHLTRMFQNRRILPRSTRRTEGSHFTEGKRVCAKQSLAYQKLRASPW
jgi:hypothetical protein